MQGALPGFGDYERRKERSRQREAFMSLKGREIGPLPAVARPDLVAACERDLRLFLETYFSATFRLAWSDDHLRVIDRLQRVILEGGQFALAMPRGNGKTSLVVGATQWAVMYGHRTFIVPVAATGPKAKGMIESLKAAVESNAVLQADFPAACYPIQRLEGNNNRAGGQILDGQRTHIKWTGDRLIFPTVAGAKSSGVIVQASGLLGSIRGLQQMRQDGETVRPNLVLLDDPQTDESARRPAQTARRLKVIDDAILGLAGPVQKIAVICPCTVIQPDDLADTLLDREIRPEWQGERTRLLVSLPTDLKWWDRYAEIRQDSLRECGDIRLATEFYRANREQADAGAVPAWPARFEQGQDSAIQYAMDKRAVNEASFLAEYQNEPRHDEVEGIETLRAAELLERCNGLPRNELPDWVTRITAFADVQQDLLPWMVVGWGKDLRGAILDYGAWPAQSKRYYTLRDVSPSLREATDQPTVESAIEVGLDQLASWLFSQAWGSQLKCEWFGVDANWPISTAIVYQAARRWPKLMPFHGRFVGAASLPMQLWKKKPGERVGHFWRTSLEGTTRVVTCDSNSWKTMVLKRLKMPAGGDGAVTWFGDKPYHHEMLCDQLSAEFAVRVSGRGRRVDEWKNRPGRDNHWWDCIVGAGVGASVIGVELPGQVKPPGRKRKSLKELHDEMLKRK